MTTKMTRRTFLKGAAAAAAAVSLSGLLTGCGGNPELPDNEVQIGAYTVKVYGLDVDQGTEMNKAGAILGKVKLQFSDGGGNWQTMKYDGMFSATVNECTLTQVAPTGRFIVTDSMGGKLHSTVEQELRLSFPNEGWRYQYQNGAMAVLTIKINGMTGTLYLVKRGQRICCHQDQTHELIKDLLPRALWKECPGLFAVLPRGRRMVLGSFSGNVKKGATVFTASLQAPCKSQARPPKFYLHFARVWSQPPAGMRYNKAVPKEAQ